MAKIVFISDNDRSPWGGSEVLWSQTASYLAQNTNHDIVIFAKYWQDEPIHYQQMRQAGCSRIVYRTKIINRLGIFKQPLVKIIPQVIQKQYQASIALALDLRLWKSFLQRELPDLIILSVGGHNSGYLWTEIARNLTIPYALIVQLVKESVIPPDNILDRVNNHYLNAKQIYCVSKQNQRLLQIQCTNPLTNSSVVFNPIPTIKETIPYPNNDNGYSLACVASLTIIHKAQDILLQVLAMNKWKQRNLRLNLYGSGVNEKYLRKLSKFLSLQNINFCGFIEDKSKIWEVNHALILPSKMEGMSLALLEAMNYGRVVITTDVGGAKEIIDDNINGFVGTTATVESLDRLLEKAWQKRGDWQKIGKLARKKVNLMAKDSSKNLSELILKQINTVNFK